MKSCCIAIALVGLVAGCDRESRSIVGPGIPRPETPSGFYVLSGQIQDSDGAAVSGAVVHLNTDSSVQTMMSGAGGEYRFDNVRGNVTLRVSKEGFLDVAPFVYVAKDVTLNVSLQRLLMLVPGTTLRGTVKAPPCDPNWDREAPCQQILFIPPVTGEYDLLLTWTGTSELDLLIDGQLSLYWSSSTGQIRAMVHGDAGVQREIRIQSYYSPQPFELTAALR